MATRTSIYISDPLRELLAEHGIVPGDTESEGLRSTSATLAAVADRYRQTCRQHMPLLTVPEWCLIFDTMNGCWMQENAALLPGQLFGIADSIRLEQIDEKWGVDAPALLEKLRTLDYAGWLALVDAAERWWSRDWAQAVDTAATVREIVGRVAE